MAVIKSRKVPGRILLGVFMISFCALMFEVSLTRILSIALWYHFAFLIVSGALMGYGAAGSWLLIFPRTKRPFFPAILFACCLVPLVSLSVFLPFDPSLLALQVFQWGYLLLMFLMLSLPFFFSGLCINLILRKYTEDSFRIYSLDLLGAALGCLTFFIIAPRFSEMAWIVIISGIAFSAALMFSSGKKQFALVMALGAVLGIACLGGFPPELRMNQYKTLPQALHYPGSRTVQTQWDDISRVDWFESPMARFAPGLSLNYRGPMPPQIGLTIDGDQITAYSSWRETDETFLRHLPIRIVLDLQPKPKKMLVMKVLGGQDLMAAANLNINRIDAQTDNRLLGEWLEKNMTLPNLKVSAIKGRAFLARSFQAYDRIVLSLEGALPTAATGMSSLKASSLKTVEGMVSLLNHLAPGGWLSIHRYLLPPPRAEFRTISTLIESMNRMGWRPEKHLGIFRTVSTIMILVSESEWKHMHKATFLRLCTELGYTPVYYPDMPLTEANRTNRFERPIYAAATRKMLLADPEPFFDQQVFDIRPVWDDRPFFYNFLRPTRLKETLTIFDHKWEALLEAGLLLPLLFVIVLVLAGVLIVLPLLMTFSKFPLRLKGMSYFFWIGLGFMAVEIVLIEKLIVFLGEPAYSLATVLTVLLASSGLGSGISQRIPERVRKQAHLLLIGVILLYAALFTAVLIQFEGKTLPVRFLIATLCIVIPGFLMGIPFPRGLQKLSETTLNRQVNLAWCLNGFASVIAACGSMLVAHYFGFTAVFLFSACAYGMGFMTSGR
jgi:hypothetical protein